MKHRMVEIKHKESGATSLVMPESVRMWSKRGWTLVDDEVDEGQLTLELGNDDPVAPDADKE